MAALKGAASEQRESKGEHEGATREQERACRDMLMLVPSLGGAQQVGAQTGCFQLGFSCLCCLIRVGAEGCTGAQ